MSPALGVWRPDPDPQPKLCDVYGIVGVSTTENGGLSAQ
jgi:hypothetical protein